MSFFVLEAAVKGARKKKRLRHEDAVEEGQQRRSSEPGLHGRRG